MRDCRDVIWGAFVGWSSGEKWILQGRLRTNFTAQRAVYCDFCNDRSGEYPRRVLHAFTGTLVSDDYAGYHALHRRGVVAAFCMAHARRKLFEAHALNASEIAAQACERWSGTAFI